MMKTPFALSLVAIATLSACVTQEPVTPVATVQSSPTYVAAPTYVTTSPAVVGTPVQVIQPGSQAVIVPGAPVAVVQQGGTQLVAQLRPGVGRITSINRLNEGGTPGYEPLRRIGLAMNDGSAQFVDTRAARLSVGDHVEITSDSQIRYPVGQVSPRY